MPRKSILRTALGILTLVGIAALPVGVWSQGGGGRGGRGQGGQGVNGGRGIYVPLPPIFAADPMSIAEGLSHFSLQVPPPEGVAIRAGRLFDSKAGRMLTNQVILVNGDMVTDVGPADRVQIPAGARVIDLSGATVLPGLIDAHVHVFDSITERMPNEATLMLRGIPLALQHLQGGYTTLVDMGSGDSWAPVDYRNAVNRGWVPGPRIQVAGPHLNPRVNRNYPTPSTDVPFGMGPFSPSGRPHIENGSGLHSPRDARRLVREHAWYGTDLIKFYLTEDLVGAGTAGGGYGSAFYPDGRMINVPSLTLEETQAITDEARAHNLKTAAHVYGGPGLRYALQAGVDLPMHAMVGFNGEEGLSDEVIRMFQAPLPNGKRRMMMHTLWDLEDDDPATSASGVGHGGGAMNTGDLRTTGGKTSRMKLTEIAFKKLHAAGIKEVFGSGEWGPLGRIPGDQSMQFPIFVKWGMTPVEALQTATVNAAEFLNYDMTNKIGVVAKGGFADIVAVPGDPLRDITEMMKVKFVMKGGVVFRNDWVAPAPPSVTLVGSR